MVGGYTAMSLDSTLAVHDEATLESLSSKGLVRRAKRDLEIGAAQVLNRDANSANVETDNQQVQITDQGPTAATCTCPATGICRHILLSVLLLRATEMPSPSENNKSSSTQLSAKDEIIQLPELDLIKFAGTDWQHAFTLAINHDPIQIDEQGLNCYISLPDSPVTITFIAGQGLKGAVFKGPKTRSRVLITLCAILIKQQAGILIEKGSIESSTQDKTLSSTLLEKIEKVVENAVIAVLSGAPEITADKLFDLAISARVQSAPRLTALLRKLAKQATWATTRHIEFIATEYLTNCAKTYALIQALKKTPQDPLLTGSLKRNYVASDSIELWLLGVAKWRTASGARGVTTYGFSPQNKQWYLTTTARGAGMDLTFKPSTAYHATLWNVGVLKDIIGYSLHLPAPKISQDNQIAQTLAEKPKRQKTLITLDQLNQGDAIIEDWAELKTNLSERIGAGLRRQSIPQPALITPAQFEPMSFDNIEQVYQWGMIDQNGEKIYLQIPADEPELAENLRVKQKKIKALLITAEPDQSTVQFRLVTIFLEEKGRLNILNIHFDRLIHQQMLGKWLNQLKEKIPYFSQPKLILSDPVSILTDTILEACVDTTVSGLDEEKAQLLIKQCETHGFLMLASALQEMSRVKTPTSILRTVYITNEIRSLNELGR